MNNCFHTIQLVISSIANTDIAVALNSVIGELYPKAMVIDKLPNINVKVRD